MRVLVFVATALTLASATEGREPVVQVSWFAAQAYCEARGARLPTTAEWELAAQADEKRADASLDPEFRRLILDWYSRPATGALEPAGSGRKNFWGVRGLHGLVWEWVLDFNSELQNDDGRGGGDAQQSRFCGAAALSARDAGDYAAFEAKLKIPEGDLVLAVDKWHEFNPCQNGGIVATYPGG